MTNDFFNETGGFSTLDIHNCHDRYKLLDWRSVLVGDLARMKNTRLRYIQQYKITGKKIDPKVFYGNAQAIKIQAAMLQQVEGRLSQLKR
jgi:hypothetical protein